MWNRLVCCVAHNRFLQGPDIPERQLYKEPPPGFLEADPLEVSDALTKTALVHN